MASTTVEVPLTGGNVDGLSGLTVELYALGTDTLGNSGGADTLSERSNNEGTYTATVTEALSGYYEVRVIRNSATFSKGFVWLNDDTGTYVCQPSLADVMLWRGAAPAALTDTNKVQSSTQHMASGIITATAIATDAIGSAELAATAITEIAAGVLDAALSSHVASDSIGAALNSLILGSNAVDDAGATDTIFDTNLTEADDFWNGYVVIWMPGTTLAGEYGTISDFANTDGQITMTAAFSGAPGNSDKFVLVRPAGGATAAEVVNEWETQSQSDPTGFHVNVKEWNGTAVTINGTSSKPDVDMAAISGDSTAADNLEAMFDGTGYTDDTAPSSRAQVSSIASVGSARSTKATFDNTTRDTIDNAAADDKGDGTVGIPVTGHAFTAGREITISGSSNYDGSYDIVSTSTNEVVITVSYSAETFGGSETINSSIKGIEFVGTLTSGTYETTHSSDDTDMQIDDDSNEIDIAFCADIGAGFLPTGLNHEGVLNGGNDELNIMAYDFVGDAWDTVGVLTGKSGAADESFSYSLEDQHVGTTGNDLGRVYYRYQNTGQSNPTLYIDSKEVENISDPRVGTYSGSAIYIDTNNGTAGVVVGFNGTDRRPVLTLADAITLNSTLGYNSFHIATGSSITLTGAATNYKFEGSGWTLAFGGQSLAGAQVMGATVSGTFAGTTAILEQCITNAITGPGVTMRSCYFNEVTFTANGAGNWYLNDCRSRVAGSASPTFDFGAGVGSTGLNLRAYSGGIEIENMGDSGTDTLSMEGDGALTINANCDGGTANIRGNIRITDNSGGNVALTITPDVTGYQEGAVWVNETNGDSAGAVVGIDGTFQNQSDDFDNAQDVADALGTALINIAAGESITLTDDLEGYVINMVQVTMNGGSQNTGGTRFNEGVFTGTFARSSGFPTFADGRIFGVPSTVTFPQFAAFRCSVVGTLTLSEAANQSLIDCQAGGTPTIDCGSLGSGFVLNLIRWAGNVTFTNLAADAVVNIQGDACGDIVLGGADATVNIDGTVASVTNNLTGSPTVTDNSISLTNITASTFDPTADDVTITSDQDVYHADVELTIDGGNSQDEYTVTWFKNGVPITSGITNAKIQVVSRSDGSDLIALTAMTEIGSTHSFKYDEGSDTTTAGEAVVVVVSATIDGSTRTWKRNRSRDSS